MPMLKNLLNTPRMRVTIFPQAAMSKNVHHGTLFIVKGANMNIYTLAKLVNTNIAAQYALPIVWVIYLKRLGSVIEIFTILEMI